MSNEIKKNNAPASSGAQSNIISIAKGTTTSNSNLTSRFYQDDLEDWSLTGDQMLFFLSNHNLIELAYGEEDMETLRDLASSDDFKAAFGDMSWDEAYDRYETMISDDSDADA